MQLQVKAQHASVPDSVHAYTEKRFSKLSRRLYEGTVVEVTFSREHNPSIRDDHVAEAVVFMKGRNLVAREAATTYEAAVDQTRRQARAPDRALPGQARARAAPSGAAKARRRTPRAKRRRRRRASAHSRARRSLRGLRPRALAATVDAVADSRGDRRAKVGGDLGCLAFEPPDLPVEDRDERRAGSWPRPRPTVGRPTSRRSRRSSRPARAS